MKPTSTVPTDYIKQLLKQVEEQGYDTNELLEDVGIDPITLEQQTEFPAKKYGELYQRVMYITQDEYFGMLNGCKLPTGTFSMMCHTIIHCKTLEHAIDRANVFHEIVRGTKIKPMIVKKGKWARILFTGVSRLDKEESEALLAKEKPEQIWTSLSIWHHFISWLIGERVELKAVNFQFSESEAPDNLSRRFQADITFNHERNNLTFPARYLDYPIVQTEATLHGFLKTAPYQLLVMVDDNGSLKAQIVALLGRNFSITPPSAEKIAQTLNMSLSTLRRRLLEENTTFQKIKDECRKNSAIEHMNSPQLSIKDVAELMGFDDSSAFFRSFKRWTGMTPGEYRLSDKYLNQLYTPKRDSFR